MWQNEETLILSHGLNYSSQMDQVQSCCLESNFLCEQWQGILQLQLTVFLGTDINNPAAIVLQYFHALKCLQI